MANVLISEATMSSIADAIREKKETSTTYLPSEMPSAISSITGGGITPTGTINITTNGTHDVTNYASASVAVPQGTTPTGTKEISITQNGTTTEDVTNYASAQITVNVPTGQSTNFGVDNTNTLSEMFYAIEHGNYSTGTVTVNSYFPANTESEFCDTGFVDNVRGILIFNTDPPNTTSNSYDTYEAMGFMGLPSTAGADQSISTTSSFTKVRNIVLNTFLTNATYITPRVNGGKLYITPTKAQTTYTFFHVGKTYRWIAWGYTS